MAEKNSLWKNIRNKAKQNRRTGATPKKPTAEMLKQERKIKAQKADGGYLYAKGGDGKDSVTLYKKAEYDPNTDRILEYAGSKGNEYYVTPNTPQGVDFERRLPEFEITDEYDSPKDSYGNKMNIASEEGAIRNPNYQPLASGKLDIDPAGQLLLAGAVANPGNLLGELASEVTMVDPTSLVKNVGKNAGKLVREQVYKAVDPIGYGVRDKILKAPQTWARNTFNPDKRLEIIGKEFNPFGIHPGDKEIRMAKNRLDSWRLGLGLDQKYDTFTNLGNNTYRINAMNPNEDVFNDLYSDILAHETTKRGYYFGDDPLINIANRNAVAKAKRSLNSEDLKNFFSSIEKNEYGNSPWQQTRIVENSKNPQFRHSIYDNDNTQAIMGNYRWDVNKLDDGTLHFQSNDTWDLNPWEKRGSINLRSNTPSPGYRKWNPFSNVEALSLVGGKPFNIQNNFMVDPKTYKIIDSYSNGGAINPYMYYAGGPMQYKRGGLLKDIGLGVADFALGTIGGVTGIQSMKDIVNEKQYSNDKFDAGANFAGSIGSTALKLIPVTAPIANAAGIVGGAANKAFGIDAANYNPNQEVSDLEKAGNIVGQAGNVASMFMGNTSGVSANAGKFMQGVDKINKFGQSPAGQLLNQGLSFEQGGNINNNSVNLQTDSMKNRYKNYRTKYKEGGIIQDKLKANGIVKIPSYVGYHFEHPDGGQAMGPNASVERDELVQLSGGGHAGMGNPEYVYPADVNNAANTNPEEGIYMPQMTNDYKMITDKYGMPRFSKKSPAKWLEEMLAKRNSEFRVDVDGPTKESNDQAMAIAKGGREVAVSVNELKQQAAQEDAMRIAMADNVAAYGGYLSKYRNLNMPKSKAKGGPMDPPDKPMITNKQVLNYIYDMNERGMLEPGRPFETNWHSNLEDRDIDLKKELSPVDLQRVKSMYDHKQNSRNKNPFGLMSPLGFAQGGPLYGNTDSEYTYAHGGPVVSNVPQDFDLYAQNRGGMMMADGGMMMPQDDSMSKQIAAALKQGTKPEDILSQLIESGMDPQQAQAMLQAIMDNIQPQAPTQAPMMAMGGTMYALGGEFLNNFSSDFNHGRRMLFNKYYRNAYKGLKNNSTNAYPNIWNDSNFGLVKDAPEDIMNAAKSQQPINYTMDPNQLTNKPELNLDGNLKAKTSNLPVGNENIFGDDKLGKALAIGQAAIPLGEAAYHMFNKPKHLKAPNTEAPIVSYDAARRTDAAETRNNYSTYVNAMRQMNQPGMRSHILEGLGSSQSALAARNAESFEREYNENAKAKAQANALDAQYKFSADQLNYDIDQARIGNIFGALNNAGTLGFQSYGDISNRKLQEKQIASTQSANVTPITINGRVYPATKGPDGYYFNGQRIAEFGT